MSETAVAPFNMIARRGDTFTRTITYLEDDETTAIDLTGYTVEWAVGTKFNDASADQYTTTPEVTVTAADGEITLTLTPTQTRALSKDVYRYELTVTSASGVATTLLDGKIHVEPEVAA